MDSGFSLHGIMLPDNCRNIPISLIDMRHEQKHGYQGLFWFFVFICIIGKVHCPDIRVGLDVHGSNLAVCCTSAANYRVVAFAACPEIRSASPG